MFRCLELHGPSPWESDPHGPSQAVIVLREAAAVTNTALAGVAGLRERVGVRYRLAVIFGPAVCAVLAGARSLIAIAE